MILREEMMKPGVNQSVRFVVVHDELHKSDERPLLLVRQIERQMHLGKIEFWRRWVKSVQYGVCVGCEAAELQKVGAVRPICGKRSSLCDHYMVPDPGLGDVLVQRPMRVGPKLFRGQPLFGSEFLDETGERSFGGRAGHVKKVGTKSQVPLYRRNVSGR